MDLLSSKQAGRGREEKVRFIQSDSQSLLSEWNGVEEEDEKHDLTQISPRGIRRCLSIQGSGHAARAVGQTATTLGQTAYSAGKNLLHSMSFMGVRRGALSVGAALVPEIFHRSANNATTRQLRSTAWLDGLRGVAAFLVVVQHMHLQAHMNLAECHNSPMGLGLRLKTPATWPFVRLFFTGGYFMVVLFFFISGYVVPRRLIGLIHQGRQQEFIDALNSAIVRRPGRLLVPVAFSTLITILVFAVTGITAYWPSPASNIFEELWFWVKDNLRLLDFYNAMMSHYNLATWTIPVELKGSMNIFVWLFATHQLRPKMRIFLTLGLMTYLVFGTNGAIYATFFAGTVTSELDLLSSHGDQHGSQPWSCITRFFAKRRLSRAIFLHSTLIFGLFLACQPTVVTTDHLTPQDAYDNCEGWPTFMFKLVPSWYWNRWPNHEYRDFWFFWAAWITAVSIKEIKWVRRIFETRVAQYLGRHSFSLYLMHGAVLAIVTRSLLLLTGVDILFGADAGWPFMDVYKKLHDQSWWPLPDGGAFGLEPNVLFSFALSIPFILYVAELGTKLLDKPSIKISAWIWTQFKAMR